MRRPYRSATLPLCLLAALVAAPSARAQTPPPPPMPACDAPDGASTVERGYQTMTMQPFVRGALKIGPVKDLGVFKPQPSPYETKEMFVQAVRYCEAVVTLQDGTNDPTYWMIQLTFNVRSWLTPSIFCSAKHDILQSECARYRPEGAVPQR